LTKQNKYDNLLSTHISKAHKILPHLVVWLGLKLF